MLALVIPYYKYDFFEATLQSLASQTNKQFHVYIGDDASLKPPTDLLEKFQNQISFTYHRFETNLGGTSLVQQWNRCLDLVQNETWVQILGDDDTLAPNVIASFYENLLEITKVNSAVVRFATQVIDEKGSPISEIYQHPKLELATDFLIRKFKGGTRSSLSEYIFKKEKVVTIQFKDFPLAWYSDLLAVFEFASFAPIYTVNEAVVYFRLSGKNITSKTDDLLIKERTTFLFYCYLLDKYSLKVELKNLVFSNLEKCVLNDKKNLNHFKQLILLYLKNLQLKRFFVFGLNFLNKI